MRNGLVRITVGAFLLLGVAACRIAPVYNVEAHKFATPSAPLSVRAQQIKQAGSSRGWKMTDTGPGEIRGNLNSGDRRASVVINFTPSEYAIRYAGSEGLDYSSGQINKRYNGWVENLEKDIYSVSRK
ncbi:MAG TPA: hypothetical protein VGD08_17690 [Stellaceae bacterium]|jgi:hypothetical protein